jgi:hypothetical protein
MSLLFLGIHPETREPIAVKALAPQFLAEAEVVKRFQKEAEIIALADHPNIVKLYGNGKWEGGLYIAMEFIQGISLKHFMTHQTMSLRRALEVTLDVAYALCHLHTHGVIHRDLKPENILLTEEGSIKVIDFGIAQVMTEGGSQKRGQPGRLMGTPLYMSPEQKEDPESVSFPSDIYSLAIIAYELVLGKLSQGKLQLSLMPKGLQGILAKALSPKPADRYQDIVDFISDISTYMNSPSLGKDTGGRDYANSVSEVLLATQRTLLTAPAPKWKGVEFGAVTPRALKISGSYYDFFDLPGGDQGILIVEPEAKGEAGLVYSAFFRGMMRTLAQLTNDPAELLGLANDLLQKENSEQIFRLSYLVLRPSESSLHYVSCQAGALWHAARGEQAPKRLEATNPPLGAVKQVSYMALTQSWDMGDVLLVSSFSSLAESRHSPAFTEQDFEVAIKANLGKAPQALIDGVYRRVVTSAPDQLRHQAFTLLALRRL